VRLPLLLLCVALAPACGKIAFDPLTDGGDAPPQIPAQPLVWLPMDDAGTSILTDATGHGHDAISGGTSMPQSAPGIHGGAAHFDGDDFASIPYAPDLDVTTATLAAWVKLDVQPADYAEIMSRQFGTASADTWILGYRDPGTPDGPGAPYQVGWQTTDSTSIVPVIGVPSTADVNTWIHVAATYDGSTARLYRNGTQIAAMPLTGTIVAETTRIVIGAADNTLTTTPDEYIKAAIDDLQIYATALSPSDIAALATP
jgi:hypothetical protein